MAFTYTMLKFKRKAHRLTKRAEIPHHTGHASQHHPCRPMVAIDYSRRIQLDWDSARTQAANFDWLDKSIARIRAERPEDANYLLHRLEDARQPLNKPRDVVAALEGLPSGMVPTLQNAAGSSLSTITKPAGGIKEKARGDLRKALQHVSISLQTAILNVMLSQNEKHGHGVKSLQTKILSVGLTVESKGADIFSSIASLASQNQVMLGVVQQNEAMLREIRDSQSLLRGGYAQGLPLLTQFNSIVRQLD
ncbi:hypothetical protein EKO27_g5219 [Xylaria grammica]|uniref:Uncharacterized protein n=1 Tax=Xylaria grammica TaxID=363999 RepID=A0A439D686_9PEZI|nr:hypothetical protein EKO27_g5219 [Xylaria grammica]